MRFLMISAALAFLIFTDQIAAQAGPPVEILKFNWSMQKPSRETVTSMDPFDTGNVRRPDRNDRPGEKTTEERSRDLLRTERTAVRDARSPFENVFLYELKIKNLVEKPIRSFVWTYQAVKDAAVAQNSSNRQFLCVEKIGAGDSKTLKMLSHLPPTNVVDASASKNKSEKDQSFDLLINRVEYADGSVWQRVGWDFTFDPARMAEKLKINDCAAL